MKNTLFIILLLATVSNLAFSQSPIYSVEDYLKGFSKLNDLGFKLGTSLEDALAANKDLTKSTSGMSFRTEYTLDINENGLKNFTFYFDNDNAKPLYEIIMAFQDPDTLNAFSYQAFGNPNHPQLEDHWVASADGKTACIVWIYDNKCILAANLTDTEFQDDYIFQLDQEFIDKLNSDEGNGDNGGNTATNNESTPEIDTFPVGNTPPTDNANTEVPADKEFTDGLNIMIREAITDFEEIKGDPVEGKKDVYRTIDNDELVLIKKNTNGGWRVEVKVGDSVTLDEANAYFDNLKNAINGLEALDYALSKKSEYSTNTGKTYIWDVSTLDGEPLGIILKIQIYAGGNNAYNVKLEVGK